MAIGFRKSFLGFNTNDVLKYIEASHKKHIAKETELSKKIEQQNAQVDDLQKKLNTLTLEKNEIELKLKEYDEKYEEINRLSENIGKLYLVAQANAQAIMKNSAESSKLADIEVEKNLSSIDNAQQSLNDIKQDLLDTTSDFSSRISELIASLGITKEKINDNKSDSQKCNEDFNTVFDLITK